MPAPSIPSEARQCYEHHLGASYFTGARFGITRLIQVIAAVSLGATAFDLAIITAANGLGLIVSLLLGSVMKYQRKLPYLVVPAFLSNFALLCVALVSDLPLFVLLVSVHGFLDTCTLPAMGSIQRSTYPAAQRGGMVGFIRSRFMLCGLISGLLMAEILETSLLSYRIILPLAGIMGFVACFHFMCMKPQEQIVRAAKSMKKSSLLDPLKNKSFLSFTLVLSLFECAHLMIQPLVPQLLMDNGVDGRGMVWFFAIIPGICGIFTFARWGKLIDKIGVVQVRAIGAVAYTLEALLLLGAGSIASALNVSPFMIIMLAALIRGLALGAIVLTWSLSPMHFASKENCSQYIGVHNFATGLRTLFAPILGVCCIQFIQPQSLFAFSALLMLMAGVLFWLQSLPSREADLTLTHA
ncbi:MAG: MFS transporter [Planctomycetes bacterium]|nr:MFS transporter [Planctomycetota bacterium]